jgi:hypothetical protein
VPSAYQSFSAFSRSSRIIDFLPCSDRGAILFTTRGRKIAADLTQSNTLELEDMDRDEAKQLMARRISNKALLDNLQAVDELLGLLSNLPLAIVQAAAFINSNQIPISEYNSLLREPDTEAELFSEQFEDPSRYREMESTIAKTWYISFDQILKHDRLAADCLSFMACIDRVGIPLSLLPLEGPALKRIKAIGTLTGYAFITERQQVDQQLQGEKIFDVHRLVHVVSARWLQENGDSAGWTKKVASRLEELLPYGGHEKRERWTNYLSHAIYVAGSNDTLSETVRASLLDRAGRCQTTLGQYSAAVTTLRQVLLLREKNLGSENALTLICMNQIVLALKDQGKYKEAEAMSRQTLTLVECSDSVTLSVTTIYSSGLTSIVDTHFYHDKAWFCDKFNRSQHFMSKSREF